MEVHILPDAATVARRAADIVGAMVQCKPAAVLGLATGSTPVALYRELGARCSAGALSLRRVTTFNLDEYLDLPPESPISYRRFMQAQLFDHTDIDVARTHFDAQ